ncbi:MAG: hypothetical protein GYB68_04215 [Chloroflexi bacterium]|nr:hypothetical protein [Chloroflexota bacterium]
MSELVEKDEASQSKTAEAVNSAVDELSTVALGQLLKLIQNESPNPEGDFRTLACDFAEHVVPLYEKAFGEKRKLMAAIEAARAFALGKGTQSELLAASFDAVEHIAGISGGKIDNAAGYAAVAASRVTGAATAASTWSTASWAASAWTSLESQDDERDWQREQASKLLKRIRTKGSERPNGQGA